MNLLLHLRSLSVCLVAGLVSVEADKPVPPTWNASWPPPPAWNSSANGPCMQKVFKNFQPNGGDLVCQAKEVFVNTATVMQGPSGCERGEDIYVNVSASIHFNAGRFDPGIYTATSSCTGGTANNNCGVVGTTCTADVLGPKDKVFSGGNVTQADPAKGQDAPILDSCYDVPGNDYDLTLYEFSKNMRLPCDDTRTDNEPSTGTVLMNTCFSWRTSGTDDENCTATGAWPGNTAKCFCQYIDLGITIIEPSAAPSSVPSSRPSRDPSSKPSRDPSSKPSRQPSSDPSSKPSRQPSIYPSSQPSRDPSSKPSRDPSSRPSRDPSSKPSRDPSSQPSSSTSPSIWLATVKGLVWIDSDFDGIQDANETAYGSGVIVILKDSVGNVLNTTQTDGNGTFCFIGAYPPGNYTVEFSTPEGYQFTTENIDRATGKVPFSLAYGEDAYIEVGVAEPESAIFTLLTCYPGCGNFSLVGEFTSTVEKMLGCNETGCEVTIVETQSVNCTPCVYNATAGRRRAQIIKDDEEIKLSGNISFSVEQILLNETLIQELLDEGLEDANNELADNDTDFRFVTILTTQAPTTRIPTFWPTCRPVGGSPVGADNPVGTPRPTSTCGNGKCDRDEKNSTCPLDCSNIILNGVTTGSSGAKGVMFALKSSRQVTVRSFEFYTYNVMNSAIQVYTRVGNYTGYEFNSTGWAKVYDKNVTYMGQTTLTTLGDLNNGGVQVSNGTVQSFYIVSTNYIMYEQGTGEGKVVSNDGALALHEGVGINTNPSNPFAVATKSVPRSFKGKIRYSITATA